MAFFAKAISTTDAAAYPRRRSSCSLASRRRSAFVRRRIVSAAASSDENDAAASSLPILYDIPVSNNGARARLVIYWKNLESDFAITNPSALGGIKSDEYLARSEVSSVRNTILQSFIHAEDQISHAPPPPLTSSVDCILFTSNRP